MCVKIIASRDPKWLSYKMSSYGFVTVFNNNNDPQKIHCIDFRGNEYYIYCFRNVENEKDKYLNFSNEILNLITNNFFSISIEQTIEMTPLLQFLKNKAMKHLQNCLK